MNSNEVFDAQKQIDFVNNRLKTDVTIKFTMANMLMKNLVLVVVLVSLFSLITYLYPFLLN